jgi:hypothetical protein
MLSKYLIPLAVVKSAPVKLIIDTDMGMDVDDVGSICIANALQDLGEAEILAIVHDTGFRLGVGPISSINNWYGHDIPLGAYKGIFGDGHSDGI